MAFHKHLKLPPLRLTQRCGTDVRVRNIQRNVLSQGSPSVESEGSVEDIRDLETHFNVDHDPFPLEPLRESTDQELHSQALRKGWDKLRKGMLLTAVESSAMPVDQLCILCSELAVLRCQECGPQIYYCRSCFASEPERTNFFHTAEKWEEVIIQQFLKSLDVAAAVARIRSLEKMNSVTVCSLLMSKTLEMSEDARTHISDLLCEMCSQQVLTSSEYAKAFSSVLTSSNDYEKDLPQWKTYLAGFAARAIAKDTVTLKEIAPTFDQGAHHPTMLVVLQALLPLIGEEELYKRFTDSKLSLTSLLPVEMRSHDSIIEITESKKLSFLYPLKRVQSELGSMLRDGATAGALYKWIESNVDVSFYSSPEFIMVVTRTILSHVTAETSLARDVSRSAIPSPDIISKEKALMSKFKTLVQKFVTDSISLQVLVVYTTQVFCHDHKFPKGLVLRLFSYWYEMDVVEGEALLQWREDMSQEYPGKGQALFQVNHWLTLVEEAENEDSSSDDN